MAPKQRQVRIEQRGGIEAIQALEQRTDEELEAETKYKAAALAILGARASERFDAETARGFFQRAIAAARPQERMQIRRMADASLALAERRAGDLKQAVERLGQAPPSGRQMFALRAMGLLIPPASAGIVARARHPFDRRADYRVARDRPRNRRARLAAIRRSRSGTGDPARSIRRDRRPGNRRHDRPTPAQSRQSPRGRLNLPRAPPGRVARAVPVPALRLPTCPHQSA